MFIEGGIYMSCVRNEKGSSLLMVIFVVAIVTILGLTLFTVNSSASKQFDNKEKQVQARHLAEMGVEHYKAAVKEKVNIFNDEPIEKKYKIENDKSVYDHDATMKNHISKLCNIIVNVKSAEHLSNILENVTTTGVYSVEEDDDFLPCDGITGSTTQLVFDIVSTGNASGTPKVIEAEVVVNTFVDDGSGGGLAPNPDDEGNKNPYPENPLWADVWNGHNLPKETCQNGVENERCIMTTTSYDGNAKQELNGNVYNNGAISFVGWYTNQSQLIVNGNMFSSTSLKLGVGPGHVNSKVKFVVKGDLIMRGSVDIVNNDFPVVICGDYSYEPPIKVEEGMLYVKGNVYERANEGSKGKLIEGYKLILDQHKDYVSQACATSNIEQPNENPNFSVQPNVDPNYVN